MTVVHYTHLFSPLSETFIYDKVVGLEALGLDVHLVTHGRKNENQRPFPQVTTLSMPDRWNPRRLFHRSVAAVRGEKPEMANWPTWRDQLCDIARRVDADLIHAHFGQQGVKAAPVAHRLGIPLVMTFYGLDISQLPQSDFWRRKYGDLWAFASSINVLSEEMKERVIQLGGPEDRTRVVHLSRDLDQYDYNPPSRPVRNLLSVGRLVEKKGHADTIRAVKQAVERGTEVTLDILGGGRLENDLRGLIQAEGIDDRVRLHGQVASDDVLQYMTEADAFILCSKTAPSGDKEGTPTVFIEAQSIGLPCIATRHAGIPEMIPDSSHQFLAPEGNVEAIASCIEQMTSCSVNELQAIADQGRRKMEEDFSREAELEKTIDIYRRLV
jgi:glycosyltransferase involved in cell wall biosynthesis